MQLDYADTMHDDKFVLEYSQASKI